MVCCRCGARSGNMAAAAAQGSSAQVLLRDTGLRFKPAGVEVAHYDAATHLLLLARRGGVLAANPSKPLEAPRVQRLLPCLRAPGCAMYSRKCYQRQCNDVDLTELQQGGSSLKLSGLLDSHRGC